MILQLVPYAIALLTLLVVLTDDLAVLSLLRWTGGVFIVAGFMLGAV